MADGVMNQSCVQYSAAPGLCPSVLGSYEMVIFISSIVPLGYWGAADGPWNLPLSGG